VIGPETLVAAIEPDLLHRHGPSVERAQPADAPALRRGADIGEVVRFRDPVEAQKLRRGQAAAIRHRLQPEERVGAHMSRSAQHVIARPPPAFDQPALRHHPERLAQRHHRHAVARGEAALGRQAVAGGKPARPDLDRQMLGDAQIRGKCARLASGGHVRRGPPDRIVEIVIPLI